MVVFLAAQVSFAGVPNVDVKMQGSMPLVWVSLLTNIRHVQKIL